MELDNKTMIDMNQNASETENINDIEKGKGRLVWNHRIEFLLAAVGYAVGFGNIWRFPWLLMKNGGGAFLIPYFIMLIIEGIPLFFLEMAIGQRHHLAPIPLWRKISPFSAGLGITQFSLSVLTEGTYVILLGWSIYYLAVSFQSQLPWDTCPETNQTTLCQNTSPSVYYWYHDALQISDGIGDDWSFNWRILLCIISASLIVCLCVIKGVQSTGKVVYITAIFPYIVLIIFLIRGLLLEGSQNGLMYLFSVDFSKIVDPYVWLQASSQVFYSLSLASGGMVTYASYNPTNQDVLADVLTISSINGITSLIAGLAVFSLLGHRAHLLTEKCKAENIFTRSRIEHIVNETLYDNYSPAMLNATALRQLRGQLRLNASSLFTVKECSIENVLEEIPSGSGLAYITMTEVITQLPGAPFFSVMFFLMLLTVGLDSSFGAVESMVSCIRDTKRFSKYRLEVVVVLISTVMCISSLPYVTKSGEYFLQLMNTYAIDITLGTIALMEIITIVLFYGIKRFCNDIHMMTGRAVGIGWKFLWCFLSPVVMTVLLVTTLIGFSGAGTTTYQVWKRNEGILGKEQYPVWAVVVGWVILLLELIWIPLFAIIAIYKYVSLKKVLYISKS